MSLTVVIPVWNEAGRVARGIAEFEVLRGLLSEPVDLVLVDDGSTDATVSMAVLPADAMLVRAPHLGKGAAVRAGVAVARGERILVSDVDWSVSPRQVVGLLEVRADVVCASREGADARRIGEPFWRHWVGRLFNGLVQQAILAGVQDSQCGCKIFSAEAALAIFPECTVSGWAFDVEVLTLAHVRGFTVREVPVVWRHEPDSRVRLRDSVGMARDVWKIAGRARRGEYQPRPGPYSNR